MSDDIPEIIDESGEVRRLGALMPPAGFVCSLPTFEAEYPVWTDDQIRKIITDPHRKPARLTFDVSWIRDQLSFGSCNGWGGASGLGKARVKRGLKRIDLSGAHLYSHINGGADRGSMLVDALAAIQKYGIAPESMVSASMIYPRLQPAGADAEALKHRGLIAYAVQTKQGFRTALAAGFPVIVALAAGSRFQRLNSQGIAGVDNGVNHAVHCDDIQIVGGTEVYDMANSWGTRYGDQGRAYLTWDSLEEGLRSHVYYAIGSTFDSED
jgi:hypothetical protein